MFRKTLTFPTLDLSLETNKIVDLPDRLAIKLLENRFIQRVDQLKVKHNKQNEY